jgi:hypothetical protein
MIRIRFDGRGLQPPSQPGSPDSRGVVLSPTIAPPHPPRKPPVAGGSVEGGGCYVGRKAPTTFHTPSATQGYPQGTSGDGYFGQGCGVNRVARAPRELMITPFSGAGAVARGLLTREMLKGSSWRRLFPDIYVHATAYDPDDHRMWCDAIALTLQAGEAIDGLSAAFLWGVDILPRAAPVSVCIPRERRRWPHPRLRVTRTSITPADVTRFAGIPVTTPLRTAFDLGRRLRRMDALAAVDALCHRRLVTPRQLVAYAGERVTSAGSRQVRELVLLAEPLSESPMETRLRLLLVDAGAPPLTPQHEVRDSRGTFVGRVDLAYPQWRIAIEYEAITIVSGRSSAATSPASTHCVRPAG